MDRQAVLIVAKELVGNKELSLTARLLLGFLLDHRNGRTGQCNPRRQTLSDELGVSIATISRALAELQEAGLIRSTKGQRTNAYKILPNQFDTAGVSAGSKRYGVPNQIDPAGPPHPLYEPIEGNKRRAVARIPPQRSNSSTPRHPRRPTMYEETMEAYYRLQRQKAGGE